ncbi:MAG: hypothetical protein HY286_14810 [Planctomycetes bacterium]|nr:hypothetical protein [Planctomycetota bacterium]
MADKDSADEVIKMICGSLSQEKREWIIAELIELFPGFGDRLSGKTNAQDFNRLVREKRISGNHFKQFFELVIPPDDISEADIAELEIQLLEGNEHRATSALNNIARVISDAELMRRLKARQKIRSSTAINTLMQSYVEACRARQVPNFLGAGNLELGAFHRAIADLLTDLELSERVTIAKVIVHQVSNLAQLVRWYWILRTPERIRSERESEALLPREVELELEKSIVDRIETESSHQSFLGRFNISGTDVLYAWAIFGGRERTTKHISNYIMSQRENVITLLTCFLDDPNMLNEASRSISLISPLQISKLHAIIDPSVLRAAVDKHFGADLEKVREPIGETEPFNGYRLIRSYLWASGIKGT